MIGNLDRRIIIQNYTATTNDFGEPVKSWTTTATIWAGVRYGQGNERIMADKETVTADCIFTIRYRTITEKTRIVYAGVNYDITHIAEVGRKRYLELLANKVQ